MADVHDKKTRSFNMSRIKSKNTKPEWIVRRFLHAAGFRYRLHERNLPGKPDIVLPKYKTAVFVQGCFWHGHLACKFSTIPKTRTEWWRSKIDRNVLNDKKNKSALIGIGWTVIEIWECNLKKNKRVETLEALLDELRKGATPQSE